jgi:ATP-dependent exoDNAse (exonuclease V) beta subunit
VSSHFFHISAEAGAGTGKTYSLVQNYLEALLGTDPSGIKKRPDQILALTFTQKAANEMRLRIAKKLNTLMAEDSSFDREELRRLVRALPNATISTFHSFCADLLRMEAKHLKINEQFQILLPHEEGDLAKNILRTMLIERIAKPDPIIRSLVARFRISSGPLSLGLIDHLYSCYQKLFEHGLKIENLLADRDIFSVEALKKDIASINEAIAHFYTTNPSEKTREKLNVLEEIFAQPITLENEADLSRRLIEIKTIIKGNFGDTFARQSLVLAVNTLVAHVIDHLTAPDEEALVALIADFHESFMARKSALLQLGYSDLLLITRDALAQTSNLESV